MAEWPADYLKRRDECPEKVVTVSTGRSFGYFVDGDANAATTVVTLHGMCQSKYLWLLPSSIPGVRQVSLDRFGYGGSSNEPKDWLLEKDPADKLTMDIVMPEYVEALEKIGVESCYVVGHSAGTIFAQGLAALLHKKGRLLGMGLMGGMPWGYHNKLNVAKFDAVNTQTGGTYGKQKGTFKGADSRGMCCCCAGYRLTPYLLIKVGGMFVYKDKARDPGFAKMYTDVMKKEDGGSEKRFKEMDDPKANFMVAATLDAYFNGNNTSLVFLNDAFRCLGCPEPNLMDTIHIDEKIPIYIFQGDTDRAMPAEVAPCYLDIYPQAKIEILEGHGHSTMFLELDRILRKVCQVE
eukprot:gnl/MRDRNA2_/MRDRNA2_133489_c0_seq1.p1 gnl/MRDRNA2_/MRDRNA2_133489_c0~~gnl/MRDRNA2_/MRDRNA2_133489_c0_seq1.p1  ORF type:complete len:350 (-),score=56.59 gnl/MRDRNA2_/MRDRNA2_133489_c0_seq1:29-1078(-)